VITGEWEPASSVLEQAVLEFARSRELYGPFLEALRGFLRIGTTTPAVREALCAIRGADRRLSPSAGQRAVLDDEETRSLIAEVLTLPDGTRGPVGAS
jgi:hypothetical protein